MPAAAQSACVYAAGFLRPAADGLVTEPLLTPTPTPPPPRKRCVEFLRLTTSKGKTVAIGNAKSGSPIQAAAANKKDGFLAAIRGYEDYYKGKPVTKGGLQQLSFLWGVAVCPTPKPVVPKPVRKEAGAARACEGARGHSRGARAARVQPQRPAAFRGAQPLQRPDTLPPQTLPAPRRWCPPPPPPPPRPPPPSPSP